MKTYHAKSELCINVRLDGGCRHVAFIPHTMGGSSLTTGDTKLQQAIEHHRFFGTLITATVVREEAREAGQSPATDSGNAQARSLSDAGDLEPEVVEFASFSDAKDYVADRWGVSRTLLKTREHIADFAYKHGVIVRIGNPHPG